MYKMTVPRYILTVLHITNDRNGQAGLNTQKTVHLWYKSTVPKNQNNLCGCHLCYNDNTPDELLIKAQESGVKIIS